MNKLWIFKVLKIGVSKTEPRLSWIVGVHFRQEFIEVGLKKRSILGVVTLEGGKNKPMPLVT